MERILQRTIEGISLDTKSLASMAEGLDTDSQSSAVATDPKEAEVLGIEDEACTMQPVGYTTTRKFNWPFSIAV